MRRDGDFPEISASAAGLGVRPDVDVKLDDQQVIQPATGGMSVSPGWRVLKSWRIPRRLRPLCPRATGNDNLYCWRWDEYQFAATDLTDDLTLRIDDEHHGLVEPKKPVTLAEFQNLIALTRQQWQIDET
jgi:hypothetical protein